MVRAYRIIFSVQEHSLAATLSSLNAELLESGPGRCGSFPIIAQISRSLSFPRSHDVELDISVSSILFYNLRSIRCS